MYRSCLTASFGLAVAAAVAIAPAVAAKPLITGSEETAATLCRDDTIATDRRVAACQEALSDGPLTDGERGEFQTLLGDALAEQDKFDEAETAYRAATDIAVRDPHPWSGLGWLYWNADRYGEAATAFENALERRPTATALAGLGSSKYRDGAADTAETLELIDAALAIDPDYAWAIRERGWTLMNSDPQEAEASFRRALTLSDLDWNAHYGLSRALSEQGKFEDALFSIGRAIELDPSPAYAYGQRAFLLRRLDRNAAALEEAEIAIKLEPDWTNGHTQKALALEALGRRTDAIQTFDGAVEAGVEDAFLLYWFADILSNDGQMARALDIINRAIGLPDSDQYDLSLKAYIALQLKDYPETLAAANGALEIDPSMPYPHYYAAVSLVHQGATEDGVGRFDAAMELGLEQHMVGAFAADLIAAGNFVEAIRLRARY